jgi:hypothetical protein
MRRRRLEEEQLTREEHDVEQDEQSIAQAPVNLPPPPLVPVGPAHDDEDEQREGERETEIDREGRASA